jgi:hypothetical protein
LSEEATALCVICGHYHKVKDEKMDRCTSGCPCGNREAVPKWKLVSLGLVRKDGKKYRSAL